MTIRVDQPLGQPLGLVALAAVFVALAPRTARADEAGTRCDVRIVHAIDDTDPTNNDVKIDPKIVLLRPYLSKPPFTAWAEFILLDEQTLELQPKVPSTFKLPNGKSASLTFVDHLPDEGGKHRVRVQLQIRDPGKPKPVLDTVFVINEGGVVLQAGMHYRKGLLILGTSCDQAHAR